MENKLSKQEKWEMYKKNISQSNIEIADEDVLKNLNEKINDCVDKINLMVDKIGQESLNSNPEHNKLISMLSEYKKNKEQYMIALKLKENPTVATHFGDDLDNRSCIYTLEKWAKENGAIDQSESLSVERVPAGKVIEGIVNVDTGGHKGNTFENTIVVDGNPPQGSKSAIEELSKLLEIDVPEQILECADAMPTKTSIFDTRSGMSLQKFTTIENVFEMAKKRLLTKELTDEQLEEFGLTDAHKSQQAIIDKASEKVKEYTKILPNGEKVVIAPEFIKAGSLVAYESGINYYASVDKHFSSEKEENGSTFAINAKPGTQLPDNIKKFGTALVEQYKDETGASGVFLHPNGSMLVAGGNKNPNFKVEMNQEELINSLNALFDEYAKKDLERQTKEKINNIDQKINMSIKNEEKIEKSEILTGEIDKEIDKKSKTK